MGIFGGGATAFLTARVALAATSPIFRTAARSIRPAVLSISTEARVAAVTTSVTLRPICLAIFFGVGVFAALAATARLMALDAVFLPLTALGATLRDPDAAFLIFFLGLA